MLAVVSALMFAACSASPVGQHDPSLTTQRSNFRQLGESIEDAIVRLRPWAPLTDDSTPSLIGDAIRQNGDAVAFILKHGLVSPPGETFAYSNSSAHLVSAVLAEALRRSDGSSPRTVLDYATERLFNPLGIDTRNAYTARFRPDDPTPFENFGFGWATDARGINIGAGQLRLRPADMLKFGQLYLDHGKWHGKQLVPEEWVAASTAPCPASSRHGMMWWLETTPSGGSAYAARGFGGQLIVVVPEHRLVIAVASQPTKDYTTDSEDVFALVSNVILRTFPNAAGCNHRVRSCKRTAARCRCRVERVDVQPWSTEEASRFLAASADHRLHALFAVGVALGLRKGELLALRWDNVDLEGGVLHVRQNVQRLPEMGLVFGPPKLNKSRRTIPLPAASAKLLRSHRANQAAETLALGPAWVDSGLVFPSTVGTVIEPRNLNRFFDELITKAGVRRIRIHDLRHTGASLLLAQNVPARVVMEILGHSQLAITTDLYSRVMSTALRAAADAMDRVFIQPN